MTALTASWFHLMEWYFECIFHPEIGVDSFPRLNQECGGIGWMDDQKERASTHKNVQR